MFLGKIFLSLHHETNQNNCLRMKKIAALLLLLAMLTACSQKEQTYKIAVSQCSIGNWRFKLNNEMLAAQHLYEEDVKVEIINCFDQSDVQVRQIDSLVNSDVDLLVVAPNEYEEVAPVLKRAKEKGVPVILFDRRADTDDYTAFIGGDNVSVGRIAAEHAAGLAAEMAERKVLEIAALQSTSPSRDRHQGFEETMRQHPEVDYECIFGDWDDHHTQDIVQEVLKREHRPNVIFCHSDFMARGAYWAVRDAKLEGQVKIIGVDGLPGADEGIEHVQQGHFAATCVYPTHGEQIVRLALDILTGKPYERQNVLPSVLITPDNVNMVALYGNEQMKLNNDLVTIQGKLENYFGLYNIQNRLLWSSMAVILLLLVAVGLTWRARKQIKRAHRRQKALNKEQTLFYTNASHQLKTPLTLIAGPVKELRERQVLKGDDEQLLEIADRNIRQLEGLVSNVLNFRKEVDSTMMHDNNVSQAAEESAADSEQLVQGEHLNMLKQDDTDELPNILIIDDNADMRRYLRTLLANNYYVMEADDGQNGLRLARESVPDLIVSDVMMPVMDGLELCQQLKEDFITSHIPVILLTARSTEAQQMEGYEHGADAYLTKPFKAELLLSRISNLLKSRQQLRQYFGDQSSAALPAGEDAKPVKLTTQNSLFMDSLKEAVRNNMSNPNLKMDDLGEQLGISRVQLYRKVKVLTGLSPIELLRQMRLERGKVLLNSTTKTVAEIAFEVGFGTPSYFTSCFKKQYGKLPMEYRSE